MPLTFQIKPRHVKTASFCGHIEDSSPACCQRTTLCMARYTAQMKESKINQMLPLLNHKQLCKDKGKHKSFSSYSQNSSCSFICPLVAIWILISALMCQSKQPEDAEIIFYLTKLLLMMPNRSQMSASAQSYFNRTNSQNHYHRSSYQQKAKICAVPI